MNIFMGAYYAWRNRNHPNTTVGPNMAFSALFFGPNGSTEHIKFVLPEHWARAKITARALAESGGSSLKNDVWKTEI